MRISDQLFTMISLLNRHICHPGDIFKSFGVPPSQGKLLFYLRYKGANQISVIANELMISKPNMTPIIDNLISHNLVKRYSDPSDRRLIIIEITSQGSKLVDECIEKLKINIEEKLKHLEENERDTLKNTVPQIIEILNKMD